MMQEKQNFFESLQDEQIYIVSNWQSQFKPESESELIFVHLPQPCFAVAV